MRRTVLSLLCLALGAFAEEETAAPSATEVRERDEAAAAAAGGDGRDYRTEEEKAEAAGDEELWGKEDPLSDVEKEEAEIASREEAYKMFMELAEKYQKKQQQVYVETEKESFHEPKELQRRAMRAMSWGDVNASNGMLMRAVQLASMDNATSAFEVRRDTATKLGVSMYLDGWTGHAFDLFKSLVSDLDFENATAIEEDADRVIWLGASFMRENTGSLEGPADFETLKKMATIHLEMFPEWKDQCLRAAFKLFMTNNEAALKDLNACQDSDTKDDRFRANYYLALYADSRFKETLARKYGKAAFRLLPSGECDTDDLSMQSFRHCVMMTFETKRNVNLKTTCPCFDDRFYTDIHGETCKDHAGYDCATYAKWPNEPDERWTKADENELIDKCPKSCGYCESEQPCEFLEGRVKGNPQGPDAGADPDRPNKKKNKNKNKRKKKKGKEL